MDVSMREPDAVSVADSEDSPRPKAVPHSTPGESAARGKAAFFRGAAFLMAADLADGPRTGLYAQLCGDAHLSNFGIFAAPDRELVFSINDFDETLPGPFEWDVKRLAASIEVAGRDVGFTEQERRAAVV